MNLHLSVIKTQLDRVIKLDRIRIVNGHHRCTGGLKTRSTVRRLEESPRASHRAFVSLSIHRYHQRRVTRSHLREKFLSGHEHLYPARPSFVTRVWDLSHHYFPRNLFRFESDKRSRVVVI